MVLANPIYHLLPSSQFSFIHASPTVLYQSASTFQFPIHHSDSSPALVPTISLSHAAAAILHTAVSL